MDCNRAINRVGDDPYVWYGVGTSEIKKLRNNKAVDTATKQALQRLVSKLNTRIESTSSILTNEMVIKGSNRGKFEQKASSTTSIFTSQEISDYKVIFSNPCSKKEYMVIVTLNKDIFFKNQEQKIQNQLIRSASVLNDLTNYNNKLFQILTNTSLKYNYYNQSKVIN